MLDEYIARYGKRLFGLCLHLCKNQADAEDLYQESWLKALKKLDSYDPSRDFEPWITCICVNSYKNILRKMGRSIMYNGFLSTEQKEAVLANVAEQEPTDYSGLHSAVDSLPEKLRITLILFYFKDMDVGLTAKTLGLPQGTVKSRLNRARQLLKEVIKSEADILF